MNVLAICPITQPIVYATSRKGDQDLGVCGLRHDAASLRMGLCAMIECGRSQTIRVAYAVLEVLSGIPAFSPRRIHERPWKSWWSAAGDGVVDPGELRIPHPHQYGGNLW